MKASCCFSVPTRCRLPAGHLSDLAARHPDVEELVVRCDPCARPEDKTLEEVCQVLPRSSPEASCHPSSSVTGAFRLIGSPGLL